MYLKHWGNLAPSVLSFFTTPLYAWLLLKFSSEAQAKFLSLRGYWSVKSASALQTLRYALKELYLQSVVVVAIKLWPNRFKDNAILVFVTPTCHNKFM